MKIEHYERLVGMAAKWADPMYPFTLRYAHDLAKYIEIVPEDGDRGFWLGEVLAHIRYDAEHDHDLSKVDLKDLEREIQRQIQKHDLRRNPSQADEKSAAIEKYVEFHRFEPKKIGEFHASFKIPSHMYEVGRAKWVTYRSGKVDPATLKKPRKPVNYIHEHDAGVVTYLTDDAAGKRCPVPQEFRDVKVLTKLGICLGFSFDDDGDVIEAVSEAPMPDLYTTPDGKCLVVVQSMRDVVAMMWGGALGVFARGIDG